LLDEGKSLRFVQPCIDVHWRLYGKQ